MTAKTFLVLLIAICTLFGCKSRAGLAEGGIYAAPQDGGKYSVVKILKIDEKGVHVRLYSNVYPQLPRSIEESTLYMAGMDRKPGESLGMGHAPISRESFASWGVVFVQQSSVSESELEGYNMWLEAGGGYF